MQLGPLQAVQSWATEAHNTPTTEFRIVLPSSGNLNQKQLKFILNRNTLRSYNA